MSAVSGALNPDSVAHDTPTDWLKAKMDATAFTVTARTLHEQLLAPLGFTMEAIHPDAPERSVTLRRQNAEVTLYWEIGPPIWIRYCLPATGSLDTPAMPSDMDLLERTLGLPSSSPPARHDDRSVLQWFFERVAPVTRRLEEGRTPVS